MKALRVFKEVKDKKVVIDVPHDFGDRIEILILPAEGAEEYWNESEIKNMGKIRHTSEQMDNEDYSKW